MVDHEKTGLLAAVQEFRRNPDKAWPNVALNVCGVCGEIIQGGELVSRHLYVGDKLREAQGTPWLPMHGGASRKAGYTGDLNNALPPSYTEWLGKHLLEEVRR